MRAAAASFETMLLEPEIRRFRGALLQWFVTYRRDLPWRRTTDPYAIWISEIMLQQTRVAAVIPYYEKFLRRFPDYRALAEAPEVDLLAHWAGLGYYYRARNMQKAAQSMRDRGSFPASHHEIRALPGVGDYTAAAVASIGFGLPHAVLDGNVFRVLSRVYNDATNIASAAGRKHFAAIADQLLDREQPGAFNQALMELGATICLPKNPQCLVCPVANPCRARQNGSQNDLPARAARQKTVSEKRVLFWIERDGKLLLWQRPADTRLMPGFWELPERLHLPHASLGQKLGSFRHAITFHDYRFEVREAQLPAVFGICQWVSLDELHTLPASTILKKARRVVAQHRDRPETALAAAASG
jgi:A/G-specific adenine glycosylase